MQLTSKFDIGDRVLIDNDSSIKAFILSVEWRAKDVVRYEVSWLDGDIRCGMFDEWRLSRVEL